MNRILIFQLVFITCVTACHGRESRPHEEVAATNVAPRPKHGAPVQAKGEFETAARLAVNLTFSQAGTNVVIDINGVNGVVILSAPTTDFDRVESGRAYDLAVDLDGAAADADGQVAVFVRGRFGGGEKSRAFSFRLPEIAGTGLRDAGQSDDAVELDGKGRRIHVLPAE